MGKAFLGDAFPRGNLLDCGVRSRSQALAAIEAKMGRKPQSLGFAIRHLGKDEFLKEIGRPMAGPFGWERDDEYVEYPDLAKTFETQAEAAAIRRQLEAATQVVELLSLGTHVVVLAPVSA